MCGATARPTAPGGRGRRSWRGRKGVYLLIVQLDRPRWLQRHDDQRGEHQNVQTGRAAHREGFLEPNVMSWASLRSGPKGPIGRHAQPVHLLQQPERLFFLS